MAGSLGRIDLMPPADVDDVQEQLDTAYKDAMSELHRQGIIPATVIDTGFHGEMPTDLSSLDDEDVGDLLNKLSIWCGFLDVELMKADAQHNSASTALNGLKRNIRIWFKVDEEGKRLTGPDKDDRVESDPRVVAATRKELMAYTRFKVVRGIREQAQRNWETVSRRITQRGQEISRMRRETNVAGVPVQGRTFRRPGMGGT
jgi:hypothetical protein